MQRLCANRNMSPGAKTVRQSKLSDMKGIPKYRLLGMLKGCVTEKCVGTHDDISCVMHVANRFGEVDMGVSQIEGPENPIFFNWVGLNPAT